MPRPSFSQGGRNRRLVAHRSVPAACQPGCGGTGRTASFACHAGLQQKNRALQPNGPSGSSRSRRACGGIVRSKLNFSIQKKAKDVRRRLQQRPVRVRTLWPLCKRRILGEAKPIMDQRSTADHLRAVNARRAALSGC